MRIEEKEGNFVIVDFNEFEAYKIARKVEMDGIHFYRSLLDGVEDVEMKKAVTLLLQEEQFHLNFFEKSLSRLQEQQEDSTEDDDLLSGIDYGIFWPYQSAADLGDIINTPRKALKLGIAVEDKTAKFYQMCIEHVSSAETKKEIEQIASEEKLHKRMFEDILSRMEKV